MQRKGIKEVQLRITDDVLKDAYANAMHVKHNREVFTMDFIHTCEPTSIVTARIVVTPERMKEILRALTDNMQKYEQKFGSIKEELVPKDIP